MSPYMKPMGLNGLRFNRRLAAAHKAAWSRRKGQRASDIKTLERVRDCIVDGRLPPENLVGARVVFDRRNDRYEVLELGTGRLMGYASFWGVQAC
jgi:hypothetical protein